MKYYFIFLILIMASFFSCKNAKITDECTLVSTGEKIEFKIPDDIKNTSPCLQYYVSKKGNPYLCYLNMRNNKILFFNINSEKLSFSIKMPRVGPQGVGKIKSFVVHNMDTILLTTGQMNVLYLIDSSGTLRRKFRIKDIKNGTNNTYIRHSFVSQRSLIVVNNKILAATHILTRPGPEDLENYKICLEIDMKNNTQQLLPMTFPPLSSRDNEPVPTYYSTLMTNDKFIYSFQSSHNLYLTDDHQKVTVIPAKSRYIKKDFKLIDLTSGSYFKTIKSSLENPGYTNFFYDKYRDVYYRFAYPGSKLDDSYKTEDMTVLSDINEFRPVFSIMILNSELEVVGEKLMPENTYHILMSFVGKEGLYISTNHIGNPGFSADYLRFELFKLEKKQD